MSNVKPIVEKKPKTVGATIKGYGATQSVEIRYFPQEITEAFPQDLMVMVNGRDTDVAYVKVSDLVQALTMVGAI